LLHSQLIVHVRDAIIAGSTGRMAMLLIIYGGPLIGLPRIDVVGMLGSLAAPSKQEAATLGGAIHFTLGILFSLIYAGLWSLGIGSPTWWWGLIFGAIHGMLIVLLLLVVMNMYSQLSQLINGRVVMIAILLNHMVFGVVVALVYST
jgi:cytochrome c biogenesis protein CcdA